MLAAKGDALAGLWIEGQKYFADGLKGEAWEQDDFPVFVQAKEWLGILPARNLVYQS